MRRLSLGIRKKITLGFYLLLFLVIGTGALTYVIVREVEQKIVYLKVFDDFLYTTLEVRRFEKNYFLYNDEADFQENMAFWGKLEQFLMGNIKTLTILMSHDSYETLWENLHKYRHTMRELHQLYQIKDLDTKAAEKSFQLEGNIRIIGKKLTDTAEEAASKERQSIQDLLQATGKVLILSIFVFVVFCIVIAAFLGRNIVSSLKILENHTRKISRGEFIAAPMNVTDPEISSLLLAFNRMTTELKARQHKLVQTEKLASLGTLLSGVAHELNNPLSNISTSAQILTEEIRDPDIDFKINLIQQIIDQTDRARDIVRTLLEFSRIKNFEKQDLLLGSLIDETILLLRGQVPSQVDIQVDISPELEVMADKQRLQQVFLNLIKNASDAIGEEGRIWISAQQVKSEKKGKELEIIVEDNGPGIPQDSLPKIFDPFFTTKDVGHGSGLGLFIVHDIIELHGGTIKVDSRPNNGTTFMIWLPTTEEKEQNNE